MALNPLPSVAGRFARKRARAGYLFVGRHVAALVMVKESNRWLGIYENLYR